MGRTYPIHLADRTGQPEKRLPVIRFFKSSQSLHGCKTIHPQINSVGAAINTNIQAAVAHDDEARPGRERSTLPTALFCAFSSKKVNTPPSPHRRTSGTPGIAQLSRRVVSIFRVVVFIPSRISLHSPASRFFSASRGIWFLDFDDFRSDVNNFFIS